MSAEKSLNPKNRGLGRGLNALFEGDDHEFMHDAPDQTTPSTNRKSVGIEELVANPHQPRRQFKEEALVELTDSIQTHGLLQPILVRPLDTPEGQKFQIIAGERRWRAAQRAQLHEVPIVIREFNDSEALQIGLVENLQREDLNPLEEAEGYQTLISQHKYKPAEIGSLVGKSRSYVANMIRLMELPPKVRAYLANGDLSVGHARALLSAENPEELADEVISTGMSVRQVEARVTQKTTSSKPVSRETIKKPERDVNTAALENQVSDILGMHVSISVGKSGKNGTLAIEFKSLDQLDDIIHRLTKK